MTVDEAGPPNVEAVGLPVAIDEPAVTALVVAKLPVTVAVPELPEVVEEIVPPTVVGKDAPPVEELPGVVEETAPPTDEVNPPVTNVVGAFVPDDVLPIALLIVNVPPVETVTELPWVVEEIDALGVTDAPVADDAFEVVAVPEAVLEETDPPPIVVPVFPIVVDETAAPSVVETDDPPVTIVVGGFDAVVPDAVLPVPPIVDVALVGNEAVLPAGVEVRTAPNVVDPPVISVVGGFDAVLPLDAVLLLDAVLVDTDPVLIVVVPLVIDGVVTEFPAALLPDIVDPLVTKVEGGFDAVVPDEVLPAPLLTETDAPVVPREDNVIGIRDVKVPGVVTNEPDVVGRTVLGIVVVKGFEVVTAKI
uniref:Uncharacterized protein n=1 Tax=Panagrolaimus davidi TaxID=227884 RepID=A0A914Q638_9BILA